MQIRKNPPTTGWARRGAIALLIGVAAFFLPLPLSSYFFFEHFSKVYPKDPENLLSALAASVVLGLALAIAATSATLVLSLIYKRMRPTAKPAA
jgi:Kef-type K+ transport system membrane component KefB